MKTRRWDFISDHRADFGVKRLCRVLGVSRSGYYRHQATEEARAGRQAREAAAVAEIRAIHAEHQGAYSAPRVHAELRARGRKINRKRVTRLMRVHHIIGRHLRRTRRTTIADKRAPPDNAVPSPTRPHSTQHQLPWPKPHSPCPRFRVKAPEPTGHAYPELVHRRRSRSRPVAQCQCLPLGLSACPPITRPLVPCGPPRN